MERLQSLRSSSLRGHAGRLSLRPRGRSHRGTVRSVGRRPRPCGSLALSFACASLNQAYNSPNPSKRPRRSSSRACSLLRGAKRARGRGIVANSEPFAENPGGSFCFNREGTFNRRLNKFSDWAQYADINRISRESLEDRREVIFNF